ncbi:MAG: bifunctional oligoribonuclease/PAP phosphatase NrnA [Pedosphaera sp.]|nr:bifunctional oligoribonuclease/PAP phosphatase NrnA [Pedosphaera sp.]MSS99925.1 bifunctional oligoribonuclease/PAP phosphatase NrnA [Pedosphaera sp.]
MKSRPQIIERILERIAESRTICVVGHVRPDGDCVGSQLALALALRGEDKRITIWNQDSVPAKLRFLDPAGLLAKPKRGEKFDLVIATDCASFERLGTVGPCIEQRKLLINIDHHGSNTRYGDINWISSREPSTGELIYRLLKWARWPITPTIANSLFTAISTDTGSFQYPSTRPATYHTAADLVKRGADLAKVCNEVYQSYPLSRARLLRHVFNKFRLAHENQIAYFWLKQADYTRTGAEPNDSEGLIDHIRDIEPVVVACVFEEAAPNLTRISLRSKDSRVNVSEIAQQFGGGGHSAAAGARITGSLLATQRRVIKAIKHALAAVK